MGRDLFSSQVNSKKNLKTSDLSFHNATPLSVILRPNTLDEFFGQDQLLGEGKALKLLIEKDAIKSLIFYGPPGTGKTSLAHIISCHTHSHFESINAVTSNVADLKKIISQAKDLRVFELEKKYVLFIDEIHRFNKAQQDVLMPSVEEGLIILIGATTENPYFTINGPLLSRSVIFQLEPLSQSALLEIAEKGIKYLSENSKISIEIDDLTRNYLVEQCSGDARKLLNTLEIMSIIGDSSKNSCLKITSELVSQAIQKKVVNYDRLGDEHYDTVSAFIKSVRGSDPDAAVYWLAKMLHAGEDLRFIMRRMLILASEDIGNADPNAIILASSCLNAVEFIGMPEARIILSQCATYLATAPKSNAAYLAIDNALSDIKKGSVQSVPKHLKDTHYSGSKALGSGEGYQYPHNYPNHFVPQKYLEKSKSYYKPSQMGFEATIQKRMAHWNKLRNESFSQKSKRGE